MNEYNKRMYDFIVEKKHHVHRREVNFESAERFAGMPHNKRVTAALCDVLSNETPLVLPNENILFWRTVKNLPDILTAQEWDKLKSEHFLHEQGKVSNLCPNYGRLICGGLQAEKGKIAIFTQQCDDEEKLNFYNCAQQSIDAVLALTERYRKEAVKQGNLSAAEVLEQVPRYGATSFRQALQSLRILQYALWCEGEYHNTLGRFDVYMYPYLKGDLDSGALTDEQAFELLLEFFLSLNRDSDLYPGIQQGDNGQSMMLGGILPDGTNAYNKLSEMCLKASIKLKLIDPKINLRVDKDTPLEIYELGTLLTKEGLGFPQYSNDDVVIEGLIRHGYDLEDARNYSVAACWEFIVPSVAVDIPNIAAINFPAIVNDTISDHLSDCTSYEQFYDAFSQKLKDQCAQTAASLYNLYIIPAPLYSVYMDGCIENAKDISQGAKYQNYGFHGVGIATAADSLYAIKKCIFEEGVFTAQKAVNIINNGFGDENEILNHLRDNMPHMGDDVDELDDIAVMVMGDYAKHLKVLKNEHGGCFRAGTGSAMFYLWYADGMGSMLSGHKKGEAFSANYSPELFVQNKGPLSVIRSFTKPNLVETINGGPLTMEFSSAMFKDVENVTKVAQLVKAFVQRGGHQLQLNSVDIDALLDAQIHPEKHRTLIVRIWGWSAYFVELDKEYQDHVISRQNFTA